jgi:transketolase
MNLFVADRRHYLKQSGRDARSLCTLAALNRINALSCIKSAEHGWLGASYSACEILTSLYFHLAEENVVLSKGHAAAMQYACLYGLGRIGRDQLLSYKDGPGALQAHPDRATPGILQNTGSLGQALSKTAGMAWAQPDRRFAVLLGDGELQEGQVHEAFQTLVHRALAQVTPILDLNGFQSDREVAQVKRLADYRRLFEGYGLRVLEIDGHDPLALAEAWREAAGRPSIIVARTIKAHGSDYLQPERGPAGLSQPWHGRVPEDALYLRIVEEQVVRAADPDLTREFAAYQERQSAAPQRPRPGHGSSVTTPSTGGAFSRALLRLLPEHPDLVVLDADLAHSCGLDPLVSHERFLEMGISEQDMVSFAGGLALAGRLPVVNTYAAFLKRAYEQILVNATEQTKILYAGHYAGLCYFTDGKTHQSLNDLSVMLTVPGLTVLDPVTPRQTEAFLEWALGPESGAVYFRLRRTPVALDLSEQPPPVGQPFVRGERFDRCFFACGPLATRLALECLESPTFSGWGLVIPSVFHGPCDRDFYRELLRPTELIVTLEEDPPPGALRSFVGRLTADLGIAPRILSKCLEGFGASFRSLAACCEHFGFTPQAVERELARWLHR